MSSKTATDNKTQQNKYAKVSVADFNIRYLTLKNIEITIHYGAYS